MWVNGVKRKVVKKLRRIRRNASIRRWNAEHREHLNQKNREMNRKNPGRLRKIRYGITPPEFESMLLKQRNACAICKKSFDLKCPVQVDHDHETKQVRGLLCSRCNGGLGYLEDSAFVSKAAQYLKRSVNAHSEET